ATNDPDMANNSATSITTVLSDANLSITKADSPDPVAAGQNLIYTLVVNNAGPDSATNVVLNDVLPNGPTFVSLSFQGGAQGNCSTPAAGATGGTANCTYPAITSGQTSQYAIRLNVPAATTGTISNTATLASATNDPTPGNNSATSITTVLSDANLSIT